MNTDAISNMILALTEFALPVPDLVLILIAVGVLALFRVSAAKRQRIAVTKVADAYVDELTRANRLAHSAESKLAKVKSELERMRRRNRPTRKRSDTEE